MKNTKLKVEIDLNLTAIYPNHMFFDKLHDNTPNYLIIYTNLDCYGQAIKYNLKTHLSRIVSKETEFVFFDKNLISNLKIYLQNNLPKDDNYTFQNFFERVFLKLFDDLDYTNIDTAFYYSYEKLQELFDEFILNTKYIINNFYY
jgi:hypothetical protein